MKDVSTANSVSMILDILERSDCLVQVVNDHGCSLVSPLHL